MKSVSTPLDNLPLRGLTVLELSSFVAAPLGGMTLRQLGAEVVRIDPPGGGPDINRWPRHNGKSLYWIGLNKGKKSVCIDWRTSTGEKLVQRLLEESGPDGGIVLTNSGGIRGPLSFESLAEVRPDLVHLTIEGRRGGGTAVDYTVNAFVGFPSITGPPDLGSPVNHVLPAWDVACGLYAAVAILAAERQRRWVNTAQELTIALEDVAFATTGHLGFFAEAEVSGVVRTPIGNDFYGGLGRDFLTADGVRFMIVILTNRHWMDLLRLTGLTSRVAELEGIVGADFANESDRFVHRSPIFDLLGTWFSKSSADEVQSLLASSSVVWALYRTFSDHIEDDDIGLASRPLFEAVEQPGVGTYLAPGSPLVWNGRQTPPETAPSLGQHTESILGDWLGMSQQELSELSDKGIIGISQPRGGGT